MNPSYAVIFPYNEHGHVTPAVALGRALAEAGVHVTLVLTATRYKHSSNMPSDTDMLCIRAIPDGKEDEGKQDDVCFQHSLQKLEPGLENLLRQLQPPPSCLISDLLYPWSQDLADRLHLPRFIFCGFPAIAFLLQYHYQTLCSKGLLPFQQGMADEVIDFIPGLPKGFRLADVLVDFLERDPEHLEVVSRIQRGLKRAAGVVITGSSYELEPDAIDALSAEGFSIYVVGPMLTEENRNHMPSLVSEDTECLQWLNTQPQGAVVYVAVGSMVSLTEKEIEEMALGLEACGQPFLWVLRPPQDGSSDPMAALPAGFQERTKARGRVVLWAPQRAVLAHASVGCFLSHCGIGSVLEALWEGVPIIGGFCKVAEQNTNLRILTKEWGVGMALQDGDLGPPLPLRCAIERCVQEMSDGERGRTVTESALQLKAVVRKVVARPDGSSYLSLLKLVDAIKLQSSQRLSPN